MKWNWKSTNPSSLISATSMSKNPWNGIESYNTDVKHQMINYLRIHEMELKDSTINLKVNLVHVVNPWNGIERNEHFLKNIAKFLMNPWNGIERHRSVALCSCLSRLWIHEMELKDNLKWSQFHCYPPDRIHEMELKDNHVDPNHLPPHNH